MNRTLQVLDQQLREISAGSVTSGFDSWLKVTEAEAEAIADRAGITLPSDSPGTTEFVADDGRLVIGIEAGNDHDGQPCKYWRVQLRSRPD